MENRISSVTDVITRLIAGGMSQAEIAAAIEADQSTVSRWAAGRVPGSVQSHALLLSLAKKRGVSLAPESHQ